VLVVAPPGSPLPSLLPDDVRLRVVTGTALNDVELREVAACFGDSRYAVVVDDCGQVVLSPSQQGFTDAPTLLEEIASPGSKGHRALIVAGDALAILSGRRRSLMRVINEVMTDGVRLLLTPTSPQVAREHGFGLEPDQFLAGPPGRGYLSADHRVTPLQVLRRTPAQRARPAARPPVVAGGTPAAGAA
jgi:S-DNA-T family DNA segregation ATPase FtsK/SpoIIIE